jgi:hypothetical protein
MQLKLVTFDKNNYSVSTQYIGIEDYATVEYRSPITGEFSPGNVRLPSIINSSIIAVIIQDSFGKAEPIQISKHQGAYLTDSGKTMEVINRPSDFDDIQIWVKYNEEGRNWEHETLSSYMEEISYRRPEYKYLVCPTGTNPDTVEKKISLEDETVIWCRWIKGTSLTFKPSNQAEYDRFCKDPDYQFIKVPVVTDPNTQGFKLT